MAHELLNTLYVTTQGAYVQKDHQTVKIKAGDETLLQVPWHHLGAVVCFGRVNVSPAVMAQCASDQRDLVFLSRGGRFRAKVIGPTSGNVLLRLAQHKTYQDIERSTAIARNIVAAKVQNSRLVLLREARQTDMTQSESALRDAAKSMANTLEDLEKAQGANEILGNEGRAGALYFSVFNHLIRVTDDAFAFHGRNRRPPKDPINALLSFIYALVRVECQAACEGVGLDPQIGFLHAVRPGRPSLALDLMEELRPFLADRLVLTLVNRRQVTAKDFSTGLGGSVSLSDDGRKKLLVAYQQRKAEEITHPVAQRKTPIGLIPHLQARLLARHLRGDLEHYPAFVAR